MSKPIDITDIILAGGALRSDVNAASAIVAKNQAVAAQAATVAARDTTLAVGVINISPLSRLSAAPTTRMSLYYYDPATKRVPLGFATDGTAFLKMNPLSQAYAQMVVVSGNPGISVSGLARAVAGAALGSPGIGLKSYWKDPATKNVALGIAADGSLFIGKYDATIASAINYTVNNPALSQLANPFIAEQGNQLIAFYGQAQVALTTEGNNTKPQFFQNMVAFLSDRFRGVLGAYTMNYDGTSQRAWLRPYVYEATFVTGQSLGSGETTAAITTTAPFPSNGFKLTGGPVVTGPATIIGGAILVAATESGKETISTSKVARILDTELAFRSSLKHVVFGNAYPGQVYTAIKKGTATYTDVMNQLARILVAGTTIVRGFDVIHGESDAANAGYEANLVEWQSDYETDIKAATGQKEPVYMFLSQTSSIRYYYPVTLNAHKSALAQLQATLDHANIVFVVPDYIFTYNDNLHIDAASQRKKGEYFARAYKRVVYEGRTWDGVRPKAFVLGSNYVDIQFYVQVAPLVLDTALCTDPGNYGFSYVDDSARTIASVALKGGTTDTIRVTLSGAIGTNAKIDYAYNNGTANTSGNAGGARGCLRDSDTAISRWDSSHLYNPCAIFQLALN